MISDIALTSSLMFSLSEVAKTSITASVRGLKVAPKLGQGMPWKLLPSLHSALALLQSSERVTLKTADLLNESGSLLIAAAASSDSIPSDKTAEATSAAEAISLVSLLRLVISPPTLQVVIKP